MSEIPASETKVFEQLEQAMVDPYVSAKIAKAMEYEARINENDYTPKKMVELANKLDKDWIYMGSTMLLSGTIRYTSPISDEPTSCHVNGLEVRSEGFYFDTEKIELNGEYLDGLRRAAHYVHFSPDEANGSSITGKVHLGDVEFIEYPFPSLKLRCQRFPINYPDLAEDIDEAVMNAEDDNDKIRRMQDFALDIDLDNPAHLELIEDVQAYINDIVSLDKDLPHYNLQILGVFALMRKGEGLVSSEAHKQFRRIATVKQVALHPDNLYESAGSKQRYVPCLEVTVHGKQSGEPSTEAIIPFTSIIWAESIRATAP